MKITDNTLIIFTVFSRQQKNQERLGHSFFQYPISELARVLGKMPPGKVPPEKLPPGNKPPRKIAPRKIAPPGKMPPENCPPLPLKEVFCKGSSCYGIS